MTTLAPVLDLVGDVKGVSLFRYGGALWAVYLRESGEMELHKSGAGILSFRSLEPATQYPKDHVAAVALEDVLCLAWAHRSLDAIYFSRWDMITMAYLQQPVSIAAGRAPALKVYKSDRLVLAHRDGVGRHVYRTSPDGGISWSAALVVDPLAITDVDLDVYPESENIAYWAETD